MILKEYFQKAQKEKWAIGQFNFSTLDQLRGILSAAKVKKSPLILGTSERESRFLGLEEIIAMVEISKNKSQVRAFLNLDHGRDLNWIKKAIDLGYSMVHFDGSDLPLEKNIKYTKKIVDYGHKKGVLVEGELGYIGGDSKFHKGGAKIKEVNLTAPEDVKRFVAETKVDCLAISFGNVHGVYSKMPDLDFKLLKKIREKTDAFLVFHGGSGTANEKIKEAIKTGVVKININTELRLAWKACLKKKLGTKEIKPYKILPDVQNNIQKKVEEKIRLFGSNNKK